MRPVIKKKYLKYGRRAYESKNDRDRSNHSQFGVNTDETDDSYKNKDYQTPPLNASIQKINSSKAAFEISNIWNSKAKEKTHAYDEFEKSNPRYSEIDNNLKLDFDVFDTDKEDFSSSMKLDSSIFKSALLSKKFMMGSEAYSKNKGFDDGKRQSMINIKSEMTSRRNSVLKIPDLPLNKSAKKSKYSETMKKYNLETKADKIIRKQKRDINENLLKKEINNCFKQSPETHMKTILELNMALDGMKDRFTKMTKKSNQLVYLQKQVKEKEKELKRKQNELSLLTQKESKMENEMMIFEFTLDENDKKQRKKKIRRLKILEKKILKYEKQLENLDNEMISKSQNVIENKEKVIEDEMDELRIELEENKDDRFLIYKLLKFEKKFDLQF
jgi:hypothetical protein